MKTKITLVLAFAMALAFTGCKSYKKTKSGLVYQIFPGSGKDSLIVAGDIIKFHFVRKLNDSVLYSSYGKMPSYIPLQSDPGSIYSPIEVFFFSKKGDSLITIEMVDTLIKRGATQQLPPNIKKGDRVTTYIKILEVYKSDSAAKKDVDIELAKDRPRQEKEMKETQAKQEEEMKKQKEEFFKKEAIEIEAMRKSGAIAAQLKEIDAYLAKKKITTAVKSGDTYVVIKEKGTGIPAVNGKYVTVKYTGRRLATDSVFQSNHYTFPLGEREVVQGWDQGLLMFNKGGKGTLYIPTYLAYGNNAASSGRPEGALIFEVEVIDVVDTKEQGEMNQRRMDSIAATKKQ